MSRWTHIAAAIYVDTYIEDTNIKTMFEDILRHAPAITGSERSADVFVNVRSGHNIYVGADCKHCQYSPTLIHTNHGYTCASPADYECQSAEFQSNVVITIAGDLRDREVAQTNREFNKFVKFLGKHCDIRVMSVQVSEF